MIQVQVSARQIVADEIVEIELVPVAGQRLLAFDAGSHIDVHLAGGLVRQYSLLNSPSESHRYCIGVLKDPASRGGSEAVHRDLRVGHVLAINGPRNNFALDPKASDNLLLAGGIGITPILSMAHALSERGREFSLHYCARAPSRAAFVDRILGSVFKSRARIHFDDGSADQRFSLRQALESRKANAHVYICGPTGFINAMKDEAACLGIPHDRIHIEHFGASVSVTGGRFIVNATRSGVVAEVGESQTIAQVLGAHGISVELSCEQGVCGTCLTPVIDGLPDHRDIYQSDEEKAKNDQITICCSRSLSPQLILDI